jgi:predicted DNA-binding transcriptional regulator AlpA
VKTYSTIRVAKHLEVTSDTLHRWIREKRVEAPPIQTLGGMQVRLWTESDLEKVMKYKAENYRKKPDRKKKVNKAT